MPIVRTICLALLLCGLPAALQAQEMSLRDSYDVVGAADDGANPYEGTVSITIVSDTTYLVEWTLGESTYSGFGMRFNDMLAANYTLADGTPGLVMYEAQEDGSLQGVWTVQGEDGVGTETLTPRE